jgi:hypothetical protein
VVLQQRRLGPDADLLGPAWGRGGEGRPPRAVPDHDPPVGDARVGPAPPRVERHALGPLHLATEPLRGVGVQRHLVGCREVHGVHLKTREVHHTAPPQRVRAAERRQRRHHERRGDHPRRRHPLSTRLLLALGFLRRRAQKATASTGGIGNGCFAQREEIVTSSLRSCRGCFVSFAKDVTCASLNKARRPVRAPHTPTTDPSAFFSFYFGLFKLYFEK